MGKTAIEWTDATWNCLTGCTPVSPGCTNCYAAQLAATRLDKNPRYRGLAVVNSRGQGVFNGKVLTHEDRLFQPLSWRNPRRVFVNSMSDVFHDAVPFEFIDKMFMVMAQCPEHTFQILTKRPERMALYLSQAKERVHRFLLARCGAYPITSTKYWKAKKAHDSFIWPLPNVWVGTSVENQETADERIPKLYQCEAAVRFLSCEPLLGRINLESLDTTVGDLKRIKDLHGDIWPGITNVIHWVIVGGESGPHARPMHPDWARALRDQCVKHNVPFFFKQWGEYGPKRGACKQYQIAYRGSHGSPGCFSQEYHTENGIPEECENDAISAMMYRVGKHKAGRLLDGRQWDEFPEVAA